MFEVKGERRVMAALAVLQESAESAIRRLDRSARADGLPSTPVIDLAGRMDDVPVFRRKDGSLYMHVDGIGLAVVLHSSPQLLITQWDCAENKAFAAPHYHSFSIEALVVLGGSCSFPNPERWLGAGDVCVIEAGVEHTWRTGHETCSMLVIWAPSLNLSVQDDA